MCSILFFSSPICGNSPLVGSFVNLGVVFGGGGGAVPLRRREKKGITTRFKSVGGSVWAEGLNGLFCSLFSLGLQKRVFLFLFLFFSARACGPRLKRGDRRGGK